MKSPSNCRVFWCIIALALPVLAGCPSRSQQPTEPEPSQAAEPDLIEAARSGEEAGRLHAIDVLGRRGTEIDGVVPALIELLKDDSALVRCHAAQALGQIGGTAKPAAEALVELVADKDKLVRREAVEALQSIRPGPEVTIPLFNKLLREAEPEIRLYVMDAMAEEGKEVVEPLTKALEHEEACYWACLVLAEIGPDAADAVPALAKLLDNEKRLEVRREAILALAAIGPKAAPAVPELIAALDGEERINAGPAAYALGCIGQEAKAAEEKLKELADSEDSSALLQTACLWALAKLNPDDEELERAVVPRLIEALKAPNQQIRETAARALIDLGPDPEFTRPLVQQVMQDASPEMLNEILGALASLGEKAVPRLIKALEYTDARPKAAAIIARIGPAAKDAVPALIEALGDDKAETRSEVLFALAAIGPDAKEAVPEVAKALDDPDEDVCYAACYALGRIGPAAVAAKAELQKKLADADQFLSMASAWALAQIDPQCSETCKTSVPVLVGALKQPDAITRIHAAEALQCLGPLAKDAVASLKKALEDDDEQVREAAAEALKAIGG